MTLEQQLSPDALHQFQSMDTPQKIQAFLDSIRAGRPPISGVTNGRQASMTGLLVRKAVDEKRRVLMKELTG